MYGFVLYMLGYFIISLLFCLFPIFFVFGLLVPQCRELLTNWLTQIFSYFLQMVFYFALLGLISAAIMNSYYRIMGFTICYNKWLSIDFTIWSKDYSNFTAGTYFTAHKIPVPADQEKAICVSECKDECENGANIDACKDGCDDKCKDSCAEGDDNCKAIERKPRYKFTKGIKYMLVPPDYKEYDYRYADYPYYDPDLSNTAIIGSGINGVSPDIKDALEEVFRDISSVIYAGTSDTTNVIKTLDHLRQFLNNNRSLDANIREVLLKLTSDAQGVMATASGISGLEKIKKRFNLLAGLINRKYTKNPDSNSTITDSEYQDILNASITAIAGKDFTANDLNTVNSKCSDFKRNEFNYIENNYNLSSILTYINDKLGNNNFLVIKEPDYVYNNSEKDALKDAFYDDVIKIVYGGDAIKNGSGEVLVSLNLWLDKISSFLTDSSGNPKFGFSKNNIVLFNNFIKQVVDYTNNSAPALKDSSYENAMKAAIDHLLNSSTGNVLYHIYDGLRTSEKAASLGKRADIENNIGSVTTNDPALQPISDLYGKNIKKYHDIIGDPSFATDYEGQADLAITLNQIIQSLKDNGLNENYFGDLNAAAIALAEAGHRGERADDLCDSLKGYGGSSSGDILDNHDFVSNLEGMLDWNSDHESNILGTGDDAYIIERIIQKGQMYATGEIFALALVVIVLAMSFDTVPRVAASIAGASPYSSTLADVFSGFFNPQSGSIIGSKIGMLVSGLQSKLQDRIGRSVNISSHVSRAGAKIAGAIGRKLDESAANSSNPNAAKFFVGGLKLIGSGIGETANISRIALGMESDISQNIRMKHNLRHIRYARAVIGRHLGLFSVSGAKYLIFKGIEHNVDKYLLDSDKEFKEKMLDIYALNKEAIHNYILGISKIKDDFKFNDDVREENINPFAKNADGSDIIDDEDDNNTSNRINYEVEDYLTSNEVGANSENIYGDIDGNNEVEDYL
ncbi:MAG: type IV secretion system protein, partial [Anaplasmataceae bacterium]|nr:type IV secretion system protein [Anaplasmataceae bacterium]